MDIGSTLRDARQRRGITLQEISRETNISLHVLEAVENNDLAHVPGGFFTRAYLRAYANQVGVNAEELVKAYLAEHAAAPDEELQGLRRRCASRGAQQSQRALPVALLAAALLFIIYNVFFSGSNDRRSYDAAAEALTSADAVRSDRVSSIPAAGKIADLVANESRLRLDIAVDDVCWVSAVADGQVVIRRLMQSGERAVVDAREEIVLRVGDAGAFTYWINGVVGRPLGGPRQAVTIHITPNNRLAFERASPTVT